MYMPRSADVTRRRILDAAYAQFYRKGFARVGVDEIAAAAKVTKRTLYYHFESKDDLLAAVLEAQHALALGTFRGWTDKLRGSAEQIVEAVFADLSKWSAKPRWSGSGFTRLAMELADLPGHPARAGARTHKKLVEAQFADVLARAGVRAPQKMAREIYILLEGATTLILIHGDRSYADVAADAAKRLLAVTDSSAVARRGKRHLD
jgi:AcrR family transcriptional regulator